MSQYTQCLEAENESLRYQIRECKKKVKTLKERAWEWFAKMNDYATEEGSRNGLTISTPSPRRWL